MTLRQKQLIKRLPRNGYNISKTAREVGYTKLYSGNSSLYKTLRNSVKVQQYISKYWDEEKHKKEINKAIKHCRKSDDRTNWLRGLEHKSNIMKLTKEDKHTDITIINLPEQQAALTKLGIPVMKNTG